MFVRTQRLTLRPGWIEDATELARAIGHWEVVRNLGRAPWPYALGDAEQFLEAMQSTPRAVSFLICARDGADAPIIGGIGYGPYGEHPYEFGYWLTPEAWGRGYASEAGRAVLDIARTMGVPHLTAGHYLDNPASGKVLRKLGFRHHGRATRYARGRGEKVECAEFALTLQEGDDAPRMAA